MKILRRLEPVVATALLALLSGCTQAILPNCVTGATTPTPSQVKRWNNALPAKELDLGIDGSGSMLGFIGNEKALFTWKSIIKGITLSAATNGIAVNSKRVGSGSTQIVNNTLEFSNPCFFQGCGIFASVSSSLDSFWKTPGIKPNKPPLRLVISDLEVNDGDISGVLGSIKPHITQGAVIGVIAVRMPFNGSVFNSQGKVIYIGEAQRPLYLLATGQRQQLHKLLTDIKGNLALSGIPINSIQLTFIEDHANAPTLTANSIYGAPPSSVSPEFPISFSGTKYNQSQQISYQLAKLTPITKNVSLSNLTTKSNAPLQADYGLVKLASIDLPGQLPTSNGLSVEGIQINENQLTVKIKIPSNEVVAAVRALVPRGKLPQHWWLTWNRQKSSISRMQNQTDGLLQLLISLGGLMVEQGTTPAASMCLAFNK